jgi:type IV pilus assembly protein PilB
MSSDPQADAFLRKILEQPNETTFRLVFADWLDETGKPWHEAWARYIRAKATADAQPHPDDTTPEIVARLTIPVAKFLGYPKSLLQFLPAPNITVRLADHVIPRNVIELMPESVARENELIPLQLQGNTLLVAMTNPHNRDTLQKLSFILNKDVVGVGCDPDDMDDAISRHYGEYETEAVDSYLVEFTDTAAPYYGPPFTPEDDGSAIARILTAVLSDALTRLADRVQMIAEADSMVVRFGGTDGWYDRDRFPLRLARPLTDRVLHLCGIARDPAPPEFATGAFQFIFNGSVYPIETGINPGPHGPAIDFALPNRSSVSVPVVT